MKSELRVLYFRASNAGLEKKNRLINPKEREILDRGAELLLEKEKIEGEELKALMEGTPSKPSENQKGLA